MQRITLVAAVAFVLTLGTAVPAQDKPAQPRFEDVAKIEFTKDEYTFTQAQLAKGVKIEYTIRVSQDYPGVIARPTGPSFHEPAGPSGLHPHESISGGGQLYSLLDLGLGQPPKEVAKTIKKGEHRHAFEWDGRNWTGPSDTGMPKGKPFPPGTYEVLVVAQGKVRTEKGDVPYKITGKAKLVVK